VLSTAFLAPPYAHPTELVSDTGVVSMYTKPGRQGKPHWVCQARPTVWAGIWPWPGRSDVGGGAGLGRQPN
jgi:hypothetical protein